MEWHALFPVTSRKVTAQTPSLREYFTDMRRADALRSCFASTHLLVAEQESHQDCHGPCQAPIHHRNADWTCDHGGSGRSRHASSATPPCWPTWISGVRLYAWEFNLHEIGPKITSTTRRTRPRRSERACALLGGALSSHFEHPEVFLASLPAFT
ncbi:uncharacterized protein B0I36DRAFT_327836 [Microdochium trichocladiopsis]|uniref:Uncharacterized protein n=1 Tax=Microdochium trichocladiopsis TaxID=1682393 RepID=A0A9P9BRY4_9PEZI|nr:uncharacterized protein B0I36DRAFT_327836 [Microdochium trichocladiopsis]KAH7027760.1 hypothetical protein B0I36DRAFT_327836 [Microdochium trichocladiopsis]